MTSRSLTRVSPLLLMLAGTALAQGTATHHRATPATARKSASTSKGSAAASSASAKQPVEGVAAVGTMPAATGSVSTLYTLRYIDLQLGTGDLAQPNKFYTVHYTGWLTDGTKFDSSHDHEGPISFPVGARRVIAGWDTGFQGMRIGGKRRLIIPYQLAYGETGRPPIPPKSDLVFDIELLAQSDTPPLPPRAPPAPPQPAAPPSQPSAPSGTIPSGTDTSTKPDAPAPQKPATKPE